MVKRRGGGPKTSATSADEDVPLTAGSLSLEDELPGSTDPSKEEQTIAPLSVEEQYGNDMYNQKVAHWKESPFAVGLTEITWALERDKKASKSPTDDDYSVESANCLCFSAAVCPHIPNAERLGNMTVFKQSTITVNAEEEDEETGEVQVVRVTRPRLDIVIGPYWPMLFLITYPLIFGVSGWTLVKAIPGKPLLLQFVWSVCTVGLIVALALTGCRDPGIMYRRHYQPSNARIPWRWSDQALTFRPRGAVYDSDTAVVVEGFDHTCPWTGTAIGRKNMLSFQFFVCLVFVCMIFDIILLTGAMSAGASARGRPHYHKIHGHF